MAERQSDIPLVSVDVVYATPEQQRLLTVRLPAGSSVADALSSAFTNILDAHTLESLAVGVWGRVVDRDRVLREGDRVELYRPLERDPREARRELAAAGKVMTELE